MLGWRNAAHCSCAVGGECKAANGERGSSFFEIYVSRGIVLIRTAMRVFRVIPRRVKRVNGEVLTPDMGVVR